MDFNSLLKKNDNNDLKIDKLVLKDDYVKVYLLDEDKKYNLALSIDDYYDLKIKKNDYLSFEQYDLYKNKEAILLAYRSAIRRLGIKDYSEKSLRKSISQKYELSLKDLDELIDKLKKLDYINDERYTKWRINSLLDQGHSKRMIYQKMLNEGINSNLIDKYYPKENELEINNINKKVDKYFKSIKNKSVNAKKQAILSKMVSLGFDSVLVKDAINKLDFNDDFKLETIKLDKELEKVINKYSKKYDKYELKNKIYTYLMSKGYKSEDIIKVISEKGY